MPLGDSERVTPNLNIPAPTIGRVVHYRGKIGLNALRPAMVVCDVNTLDPRGVAAGAIPGLDDEMHVHLRVFGPGDEFTEYNVGPGTGPGEWSWPHRV